jgi:hypothetical protein
MGDLYYDAAESVLLRRKREIIAEIAAIREAERQIKLAYLATAKNSIEQRLMRCSLKLPKTK